MSFMDPEKMLGALQTLQMMGSSKEQGIGLGKAFLAVGHNELLNVGERIKSSFGDEVAEKYLVKQGLIDIEESAA